MSGIRRPPSPCQREVRHGDRTRVVERALICRPKWPGRPGAIVIQPSRRRSRSSGFTSRRPCRPHGRPRGPPPERVGGQRHEHGTRRQPCSASAARCAARCPTRRSPASARPSTPDRIGTPSVDAPTASTPSPSAIGGDIGRWPSRTSSERISKRIDVVVLGDQNLERPCGGASPVEPFRPPVLGRRAGGGNAIRGAQSRAASEAARIGLTR